MTDQERVDLPARGLVGEHEVLYVHDARYKYAIDLLARTMIVVAEAVTGESVIR